MPSATDNIPLIGAYYCLNMIIIAISECWCTIVVHIYFRGNGKVPFYLRKIFLVFLADAFCMSTESNSNKESGNKTSLPVTMITSIKSSKNKSYNISHYLNSTQKYPLENQYFSSQKNKIFPNYIEDRDNSLNFVSHENISASNHRILQHYHTHQQSDQLNNGLRLSLTLIENDVREIRDYIRHTRNKCENVDSKAKQSNEWKQLALVLDRALFFIYLFSMIVSSTFLIL